VSAAEGTPTPLVVITTNEERELPAAFVRRCLVLNLQLPKSENDFIAALIARGRLHFKQRCADRGVSDAAGQLWQDRQAAEDQGLQGPGQAEYIDLLRVVVTLEPDPQKQSALLGKVQDFALRKHPPAG
jgi:MoxR-like ATPase